MNQYRHHVSGFFAQQVDAEYVLAELLALGLPRERLYLFDADSAPMEAAAQADDNRLLNNVLDDGAIGTAVGGGIAVFAELAMVATNVTLFIASPLIAPLLILGWGASLGGLVGAAVGASSHAADTTERKDSFSALIRDAVASGHVVLVVETWTEEETMTARRVVQASIGASEDDLSDMVIGD